MRLAGSRLSDDAVVAARGLLHEIAEAQVHG